MTPWSAVKSRRGAMGRILTQPFACPNRRCAYYRITDAQVHALVGDGAHGRCEPLQTLRCQACGTTFSTRRGYPLGDAALSSENRIPAPCGSAHCSGSRLSVAAAVRVFGHRHATITTWLTRAGTHSATLHDRTFRHLEVPHIQFDELRTLKRCRAHTLWLWVAVDPLSKIMVVLRLGPRTQDAAPRGPRSVWPAGSWVHPHLYQRRIEPLFLRPDRSFWAVGGGCGAAGPPVASSQRGCSMAR